MQALTRQAESVQAAGVAPEAVIVRGLKAKMTELAVFRQGWFQVQDEAAQLVSVLLAPRPGETVLDLCAGRGGKTGHIAQLMGNRGKIVAVDSNAGRLTQLREEMQRLGVSIAAPEQLDATRRPPDAFGGRFDRVLIDAPCSGLGTLGRNPDIRWTSSAAELLGLSGMQARLLEHAAGYVKPGGLLVYSVCSPEPEETEAVVQSFLSKNRGFRIESRTDELPGSVRPLVDTRGCLQTYPHLRYMDGFFAARLIHKIKH
jgi:16S rRNA (cytosine967-C5)-methyltransferase